MNISIPENKLISNFIKSTNLIEIYSGNVIKMIIAILTAMALKGFTAKMTDIAEVTECHRTTVSYFLSKAAWDDDPIKELIKRDSFKYIEQLSIETGTPMFVIHDDTVNPKRKPSSQALRPIEGTAFHHSHLLNKTVWGHQVQSTMVSCGNVALNYDLHRYDNSKKDEENKKDEEVESPKKGKKEKDRKNIKTKIDYAVELISGLPVPKTKAYFMADSWYSCGKIINTCAARGYHYIGALKTNRIIYPQGIRIQIAEFAAKYIELNDVDLVTVNSQEYYVYRYEGKLNDIDNAVVILSWPKDAFKNPKALKAFICTDISLSTITILEYYTNRWCIETFFSQAKDSIGFGKYQIRSIKGIERLWTLMSLFHLLCTTGLDKTMPFGEGMRLLRKNILEERVTFIYQCAKRDVPIEEVLAACV